MSKNLSSIKSPIDVRLSSEKIQVQWFYMFCGEITQFIVARSKQLLCFRESFMKGFFLNLQIWNILANVYCRQLIDLFLFA